MINYFRCTPSLRELDRHFTVNSGTGEKEKTIDYEIDFRIWQGIPHFDWYTLVVNVFLAGSGISFGVLQLRIMI